MLEYYENGGIGAQKSIDVQRIKELMEGGDEISLDQQEVELVQQARARYALLKSVYELSSEGSLTRIIADLILSEEEFPSQEIEALVSRGATAVPALIELLSSEDFYHPLFPGYGRAPALAALCLGKIRDERAIAPLKAALGKDPEFTDPIILDALSRFSK